MSITNASSTQKLVTNAWIAFTGTAPSAANYAAHVAFVGTSGAAAYISFLSSHAKTIPAATLASNLLTNLGLSSVFTAAEALAYINSNLNNLGEAITRVSEATLNYVSDSTFSKNAEMLAAKAAYTATATTALTHSSNSANTSSAQAVTPAPSAPVGPAAPDGATIILTTGVDKGAAFVGTAKADTFNAPILTLNAGDEIDGNAGRDTLNATINGNVAATTRISNIEVLNFTAFGARTVDTLNILGAEKFSSIDSTGKVTFTNVASLAPIFGVSGPNNAQIDVTFAAGLLGGSNDRVNFELASVTAAELTVTGGGIEVSDLTVVGGSSSLKVLSAGAPNVNISGSGSSLKIIETAAVGGVAAFTALDGLTSINASNFQGAVIGNTIGSNGFSTDNILGAATGSSITLGSGNDNLKFESKANATTITNTILLGGGNNTLEFLSIATNGSTFISAGSGSDTVKIIGGANTGLRSSDLINLGTGNDTVRLANEHVNTLVLQGVENLILEATAVGANVINFTDTPLTVTVLAGAAASTVANLTGLTTGSKATVSNTANVTTGVHDLTLGWATKQAAESIVFNAKQDGFTTVSNVTALTLDHKEAVTSGAAENITAANATSINIIAAKGYTVGDIGNGADGAGTLLKTLTVVGQDAVAVVDVNSTALETVTITGAKDVSAGTLTEATKLVAVNLTSSTGSVGLGAIGAADKNNVTSDLNITVTAAKAATLAAVGHATAAGKLGNLTVTAADGLLTTGVITAGAVGTINLTSTNGAIKGAATKAIIAADSTGINVNLTAKGAINDGAGTPAVFVVENTGGNITATVAGTTTTAAASGAIVNFTTATSGLINLTATNTGGLLSNVTNTGTAGTAQTSTLTLGNAASGKENVLTVTGTVDNVVINGGSGVDQIKFGTANALKTATIALGLGADSVDFSGLAGASTKTLGDGAGTSGIAINLSNNSFTFDNGTANATTIQANTFAQHAVAGTKKLVENGFSGTITGATSVVGTGVADHIIASNTATTIEGGAGADTIILTTPGAVDTLVYRNKAHGTDSITGFQLGSGGDIFRFHDIATDLDLAGTATKAFVSGTNAALKASAAGVVTATTNIIVLTDAVTTFTADGISLILKDIDAGTDAVLGTAGIIVVAAAATGNAKVFFDFNGKTDEGGTILAELVGVNLASLANMTTDNFSIVA